MIWNKFSGLLDFFPFLWFFSCLLHFCFLDFFILAVPMRECLGRHSCMSSTFSVSILNNLCFLLSPGYYFILECEFYWTKYKINYNNTNNNCVNKVLKAMRNQLIRDKLSVWTPSTICSRVQLSLRHQVDGRTFCSRLFITRAPK